MKKWFLTLLLGLFSLYAYSMPLPAEEVFKVTTRLIDPNTFIVNWQIAEGHFLYHDRIKISQEPPRFLDIGELRFPRSLKKMDKLGHTQHIYQQMLSLPVAILSKKAGVFYLNLSFQGCAENGFCYPPQTLRIKLTIANNLSLNQVDLEPISNSSAPITTSSNNNRDAITAIFDHHHWAMILLIFFGLGLLLAFTPCVLPMVPVLSGIIIGQGKQLSTRKAMFLSLSYVLSMATTYAIIGAVIAQLGSNLQIIMQSPFAISLLCLIFVILAFSVFGFFEIKLPTSWQSKLIKTSGSQTSGYYLSAAVMGCLSTLILSPCVTAPLIGALGYIAQSGNVLLGSLALFFLGLGLGAPLLLIGTSMGKWLPRSGNWMNTVKDFFGFLLLALAIFLLSRIISPSLTLALWGSLLIFASIYAGALIPAVTTKRKVQQGFSILLLIYGTLLLIGASMGNHDPLQPLAVSRKPLNSHNHLGLTNQSITTLAQLQQALTKAKGRPVMVDFYADWCTSCKIIEATTLKNKHIKQALKNFVILKVDMTQNGVVDQALVQKYHIVAPPTFIFFDRQGKELAAHRLVGDQSIHTFLEKLRLVRQS